MALYSTNATASTMADRNMKVLDAAVQLRDYTATAATGDANGTAVEFYAEDYKAYKVVLNHAAIGGTVDGSNYWTVYIEADTESGFTDAVTLASVQLTAAAAEYNLPLSGERAAALRVAASLTTRLKYVRIRLDETGTTAGNLTVGAFISPL